MRVDALEVAQHVEMERTRLYTFRSTFAQPRQMTVRTGEFCGSTFRLFAPDATTRKINARVKILQYCS